MNTLILTITRSRVITPEPNTPVQLFSLFEMDAGRVAASYPDLTAGQMLERVDEWAREKTAPPLRRVK